MEVDALLKHPETIGELAKLCVCQFVEWVYINKFTRNLSFLSHLA